MLTRAVELTAASGTDRDALATRAHVTRTDLDLLVPPRCRPALEAHQPDQSGDSSSAPKTTLETSR